MWQCNLKTSDEGYIKPRYLTTQEEVCGTLDSRNSGTKERTSTH